MIKLKEADFDEVYEGDEDENARGQEEIRLEVDELTPVFAALRKDGWSIERNPLIAMRSQFDYGKKVRYSRRASTHCRTIYLGKTSKKNNCYCCCWYRRCFWGCRILCW